MGTKVAAMTRRRNQKGRRVAKLQEVQGLVALLGRRGLMERSASSSEGKKAEFPHFRN